MDVEGREVALRPLGEAPLLHDGAGLLELDELAADVAAEQLEARALLGAVPRLGRRAREGRDALRVGEGLVELGGGGAELLVVGEGCGVDGGALAGGAGCGGGGGRVLGLVQRGALVDLGRREATPRV